MNPTPMDWTLLTLMGISFIVFFFQGEVVRRLEEMLDVQVRINDTLIRDIEALEVKTAWMQMPPEMSETVVDAPDYVIDTEFLADEQHVGSPKRYG